MNPVAKELLLKLLLAGEKHDAGVRSRHAALTGQHLKDYQTLTSLQSKEAIDVVLRQARDQGAVILTWGDLGEYGFVKRIDLASLEKLAAFLGEQPVGVRMKLARSRLAGDLAAFPVLNDVLDRWRQLKTVRGTDPSKVEDWVDALCVLKDRVTIHHDTDLPIREVSARIFNDSKRLERLTPQIEVLLTGSIDSEARPVSDVWQEIGVFREEQPVLMSGDLEIRRTRVSALLDYPYAGFPAYAVQGVAGRPPTTLLTIENLTTFHSESRRNHDDSKLLIYTAGTPTPAWRAMYRRILESIPDDVPCMHWGDVDEGGYRIASMIAQESKATGRLLLPWRMSPQDVPEERRRRASAQTLERMAHFAKRAGWISLAESIVAAGFTVEQEAL